eukprot:12411275-Karenia_brevis.AAC.1
MFQCNDGLCNENFDLYVRTYTTSREMSAALDAYFASTSKAAALVEVARVVTIAEAVVSDVALCSTRSTARKKALAMVSARDTFEAEYAGEEEMYPPITAADYLNWLPNWDARTLFYYASCEHHVKTEAKLTGRIMRKKQRSQGIPRVPCFTTQDANTT